MDRGVSQAIITTCLQAVPPPGGMQSILMSTSLKQMQAPCARCARTFRPLHRTSRPPPAHATFDAVSALECSSRFTSSSLKFWQNGAHGTPCLARRCPPGRRGLPWSASLPERRPLRSPAFMGPPQSRMHQRKPKQARCYAASHNVSHLQVLDPLGAWDGEYILALRSPDTSGRPSVLGQVLQPSLSCMRPLAGGHVLLACEAAPAHAPRRARAAPA